MRYWPSPSARAGYVLLAVLWIAAAAAGLSLTVVATARHAIATSRNRIALTEAEWLARGCIARLYAMATLELQREPKWTPGSMSSAWVNLDSLLASMNGSAGADCSISVRANGSRLDVNHADDQMLARLFRRLGMQDAQADSFAHAISDWRDADTVPRLFGAEREWYLASRLPPPPNRPIADLRELAHVKGFDGKLALQDYLGVGQGAVSINHASETVLASLPGFSEEAVIRAVEMQRRGRVMRTYTDISGGLVPHLRDSLNAAIPQLASRTLFMPKSWMAVAEASSGNPPMKMSVEVRIERAVQGIHLTRHWVRVQ
jgi:type II secretory pathway component PulK